MATPTADSHVTPLANRLVLEDIESPLSEVTAAVRVTSIGSAHVAELEAAVETLSRENERLTGLERHRRQDLMLKDAFLSELRLEIQTKDHEAAAHTDRIRSMDEEVAALRREIARLHESIARTLSQPRYRLVDRANTALKTLPFIHRFLKSRYRRA